MHIHQYELPHNHQQARTRDESSNPSQEKNSTSCRNKLTMKHAPQKLAPSLPKPRTIHKSLKIDSENLLPSPNPSYERYK